MLKNALCWKNDCKIRRAVESSPTSSIASCGWGHCSQAPALFFNAKDFNAPYSPALTSSAAWPRELKRRFYDDSVLWRSKWEAKWRHAPREAGQVWEHAPRFRRWSYFIPSKNNWSIKQQMLCFCFFCAFFANFFTSNSVVFVGGGRKNISCSQTQGTLVTPLTVIAWSRFNSHPYRVALLRPWIRRFTTIISA